MKTSRALLTASLVIGSSAFASLAHAAKEPEAPVPVTNTLPQAPASREVYNYEQRAYGPTGAMIAPDKARAVLDAFRAANEKLGSPRYLVFVNRELVENSGLTLSGRTERTESGRSETNSSFETDPNAPKPEAANPQTQINVAVGGGNAGTGSANTPPGKGAVDSKTTKVSAENTYTSTGKTAPTLADRQTTREVERLLGRPLRYAGAKLADPKVAAALIADRPLDHFTAPTDEAARKDREALAKVADIAIEALVSSRTATVVGVAGDETVNVPDIQLTAIRLSDSAVIGQASSADILGKDQQAGPLAKKFDIRDITEATALALLEDITVTTK
ncbi:hypothetical protein CMV30_06500 [Nibricoccus aquaticus]|uniref:Uncharacterized protein n=1 Tax=Nibricoccus aquaticus TaxID=2576891 RepID=A0A290Q5S2_9BACT|nr:hypothetical protein [Nibricoccus aquaticus]ATC63627.1 hypothetical protein CMV30_06500 [Nibricoccus aquaticus]